MARPNNEPQQLPPRDGGAIQSKYGPSRSSPTNADEDVAGILNSAIRKTKSPTTVRGTNKWSLNPLNYLRRKGDAPRNEPSEELAEEPEDGENEVGQDKDAGDNGEMSPQESHSVDDQVEIPAIRLPKRGPRYAPKITKIIPPPKNYAKRKHPEPRPDGYEVPDDEPASTIKTPPTKRRRTVAKQPIVAPRTTRATSQKLPEPTTLRSGKVVIETPNKEPTLASPKPKVGRPRKQKNQTPQAVEVVISTHQNEDQIGYNQSPTTAARPQEQEEEFDHEGFTDILDHPSPVKVQRPSQVPRRTVSQSKGRATSKSTAALKRTFAGPSEQEKPAAERESSEEDSMDDSIEGSDHSEDEVSGNAIFGTNALLEMLKTSRHVGWSWNKEEELYIQKKKHTKPTTELGEALLGDLRDLIEVYRLSEKGEYLDSDENSTTIQSTLSALEAEADRVLTEVLGNPKRDEKSLAVLEDLYFCVLPKLVRAIYVAAGLYTLREDMKQSALKEVLKLAKILKGLAEGAVKHSSTPREDGTKLVKPNYHFTRPTKENIPRINKLCASLENELDRRQRAKRRGEREQLKLQQEKERKKQEEKRRLAIQRDIEQRRRGQEEDLRRQLEDPVIGHMCRVEFTKLGWPASQIPSSSRPHEARRRNEPDEDLPDSDYDDTPLDGDEEDADEDDEPELQRVSVFEKNNNRQEDGPKPWSKEEKLYFIDFLKHDNGEDRYERIAEAMDRSMDDIFATAKDLQDAMDRAHEEGIMDGEGDYWTYSIWVPEDRN